MKKTGYFFLIFVPLIIAIVVQLLASLYTGGLGAVLIAFSGVHSYSDFMSAFTDLYMDKDFNAVMMIIYALITICLFGLWYYIKYEADYLPIRHHRFSKKNLLSALGIIILVPGAQFAATMICSGMIIIAPKAFERYEHLLEMAGMDEKMTFFLFLYSVILGPISEELIFRGVTYSIARRIFRFWPANLIQAALFGLFHMNLIQGIYAFALGVLLGYVCEKGKSIYFSLLLHMLFNLWAATMTLMLDIENNPVVALLIVPLTIVSLIVGLVPFNLGLKTSKNQDSLQSS